MQIVFLFYDGMAALDAIGPHEILCRLPGAVVRRAALQSGMINTDSELQLKADYSLKEVSQADVLVIPGAGSATTLLHSQETLTWVRTLHATTSWTASICTGSLILGAAGVLFGLNATSHWAALDRLSRWGAMPINSRIVEDGKVITAAGVSAGIDMALVLAAKLSGQQMARRLQLGIEYDPEPPFDVGSPEKADPVEVEWLRAKMTEGFEEIDFAGKL